MIPALLVIAGLASVSLTETVRRVYFENSNSSFFNGLLYDNSMAFCYSDPKRPANAYMEKFTDSSNPYFETDIASLTRETVEVNVTGRSVYFDLDYKSIEQRLELKGLNGQPDDLLFSIKLAKSVAVNATADSYDVTISFKNSSCDKVFSAATINNATVFSHSITCVNGYLGSVNTLVNIAPQVTYACQTQSAGNLLADKTAPTTGMQIDFFYGLIPGAVFRAYYPSTGYSFQDEGQIDFKDIYQVLTYALQFEQKPVTGNGILRFAQSLMNVSITYVDPACTVISGTKCTQCSNEYQFVNGACVCNKNGTIEQYKGYGVNANYIINGVATTENSTYFQEQCRLLGKGLDQTAATCETQVDFFLKKKYFISMTKSTADSAVINLTLFNTDPGLNDAAKNCPNYQPVLSLYIVNHDTYYDIGEHAMGYPVLHDHKPDLTVATYNKLISVNDIMNKIKYYCKSTYLETLPVTYECELHARIGPATHLISQEQLFGLNVMNLNSAALREPVQIQVFNFNYTKPYFDSLYKSDPNFKVTVRTYNTSNTDLDSVNYDDRFILNTFGRFEKNQIVRFVFELVNLTTTSRYSLTNFVKKAVFSDSSDSLSYVGDSCNSTFQNSSFFQTLILDCKFDLKANISYNIDLTMTRRQMKVSPETMGTSFVFMFEVYQTKEKIMLAGLGKTVTIILIVIILLLMTVIMCYLAIKAGAARHLDIDKVKDTLKEGVTKAKGIYKSVKKNVKETFKDDKSKNKELKNKLLDDIDADEEVRKPKKGKKKKGNTSSEDDDQVPESLKKNDISAIKPVAIKQSDSHEDIFEEVKKGKRGKAVKDSDDDHTPPKKGLSSSKIGKPVTPLTAPKKDDLKFDSQDEDRDNDSEDDDFEEKQKAKKDQRSKNK